jgi:hypothetical protein
MMPLTPLGDPDALVCDGDVCVIPTGVAAAERAGVEGSPAEGAATPDR